MPKAKTKEKKLDAPGKQRSVSDAKEKPIKLSKGNKSFRNKEIPQDF